MAGQNQTTTEEELETTGEATGSGTAADFSFLDLPDDELANYVPTAATAEVTAPTEAPAPVVEAAKDEPEVPATSEVTGTAAPTEITEEEPAPLAAPDAALADPHAGKEAPTGADASKVGKVEGSTGEETKEEPAKEAPKETTPEASKVDYEAEYKRLLAPFKANGKEIAIESVDDAIQLMQMGANYNKKMAAMKPHLQMLKMLENNGLLSEEKLGFLIDLSRKDTGAINKLVKDSGLDPLDLSAEKAGEYKPGTHTVDPKEIELDAVLEEIQTTPSYNRTLEVVTKQWDQASKAKIADEPKILAVINSHIERGIYDLIQAGIERERTFGRLNGLSDLDAYKAVGDAIHARGGFNHLFPQQAVQEEKAPTAQPVQKAVTKAQEEDPALKARRLAASGSKPAAAASEPADFNPLNMSDDEFKKVNRKYL